MVGFCKFDLQAPGTRQKSKGGKPAILGIVRYGIVLHGTQAPCYPFRPLRRISEVANACTPKFAQ